MGIFLGSYVGLGLLAFLFLWAATSLVDQEVPQEHDSRFYRRIVKAYIPAIWSLLGMQVDIQGAEQLPKEGRFLLVCNHLGILDPVVLLGAFPKAQLAFVSKKENSHMFIIGNLMHKIMCQNIDRENDREALKTILKCIQLLKTDEVSVGVFPEGYTSHDGKVHHFRKLRGGQSLFISIFLNVTPYGIVDILIKDQLFRLFHYEPPPNKSVAKCRQNVC